jgi:hypothetical protein
MKDFKIRILIPLFMLSITSSDVIAQQMKGASKSPTNERQSTVTTPPENGNTPTEEVETPKAHSGMSPNILIETITSLGKDVVVNENRSITFTYDGAQLIAMVAEEANRMRLVSPVISATDLNEAQLAATLVSNYHLALDARYAVGDGVLYSAYIHPLKELTVQQLISAIRQVATLRNTFGTSYTSGELSFGIQSADRIDI